MSSNTQIRMPVNPSTYFVNHARGNNAPRNGQELYFKPTQPLLDWINFAQRDLQGSPRSQVDVVSLAVDFGASRPQVSWGKPVWRFGDIDQELRLQEMSGDRLRNFGPGSMDVSSEHKTLDRTVRCYVDQNTNELLDQYQALLRVNQSVIMRHLLALSFRWYDREVYHDNRVYEYARLMDPYVDRLKGEMNARIEYANDELGMDI